MASVTFDKATRLYPGGTRPAVDKLNLEVADGEFLVLVGPSGCGKSTSLRMLAGLEEVNAGRILIGDRDVTDVPPKDRDIAMVFQNYALYPHMTVAENMGFALKIAGVGKEERAARVLEAAKLLDLEQYLTRKPKALSGGQRQRVAMGRAIVRQPQVFLMDEPLSNLDAKLRVQTRTQIASLQRRLGVTTVYVTHDQTEALTMGDRIAVLKDGLLQQVGTPRDLYERPNNVFVAGFIGSPAMNLFPADLAEGGVQFGTAVVPLDRDTVGRANGSQVTIGVRPEDIVVGPADGKGLSVVVDLVEELGADGYLYGHTDIAGKRTDIVARVDGRRHPNAGDTVTLAATAGHVHAFDVEIGRAPQRRSGHLGQLASRPRRGGSSTPRAAVFCSAPSQGKPCPTHSASPRARVDPGLLTSPGRRRSAEWPSSTIVSLPKGISRHLVRFANLSGRVVAIKETTEEMARREYDMLGNLARLDAPCVERVAVITGRTDADGRAASRRARHRAPEVLAPVPRAVHAGAAPRHRDAPRRRARRAARAPAQRRLLLGRRVAVEHAVPPRRRRLRRVPRRRRDRRAPRERLTPGQRAHDLEIARINIAGEIMDLEAGGRLEGGVDADRDRGRHHVVVPLAVGGTHRSRVVLVRRVAGASPSASSGSTTSASTSARCRSRRRPTAPACRSSRRSSMPGTTSAACCA